MKTNIIFLLAMFQALSGLGQVSTSYTVQATVIGTDTKAPLAYANVFNKRLLTGTATNLEGYFEFPNNQIGDTLTISYLGYMDQQLIVSANEVNEISLRPNTAVLDEVVITAKSDYLYDLIARTRKNKNTPSKKAKTYFYLESFISDEPVEIIEAFYNGQYANLGIDQLKLKKGRIGLKPLNSRYFTSTESSRLFSRHDIFTKSELFPDNPLCLRKREMKANYSLKLNHIYYEDQSKIYVIDFSPKDENPAFFSGTVWIHQDRKQILKINLRIQNAGIHPFLPIGFDTIHQVNMEITRSYASIDQQPFVNTIDFIYDVIYFDRYSNKTTTTTKAFTKAYDYQNQFKLPYFNFTQHLHEDYRNITAIPYDSLFWKESTEFRFYDRMQHVEDFIIENRVESTLIQPDSEVDSSRYQLQFPYLAWNPNRFIMWEAPAPVIQRSDAENRFERDRYNLGLKLYLDVNKIRDSLIYQLYALLDPIDTYYHFNIERLDLAFLNMQFDLMEIQKRKLAAELSQQIPLTQETADRLYQKHMDLFEENYERFISEVNRGYNPRRLKHWNRYIKENLGINNLDLFEL